MEGVVAERDILRALKDYTELRAVLVINGKRWTCTCPTYGRNQRG